MSDDFQNRSFTLRDEGYDRAEVDGHVRDMQGEISELRRALESSTSTATRDARLHDPDGAVKRTLAIAQETADRVLHDAQVEADRLRSEADEQSSATVAESEARAAKMLADIEAQAAEVREQGIAAARSAIKVERDKATAELAQVRRVRNDLRAEAVELKAALDQYRHQAREASDTLSVAASGPLIAVELPDYVDDEVALAGVVSGGQMVAVDEPDVVLSVADQELGAEVAQLDEVLEPAEVAEAVDAEPLAAVDDEYVDLDDGLADVISLDAEPAHPTYVDHVDAAVEPEPAPVGAFLSEIQAAGDAPSESTFAAITDLEVDDAGGDDSDRFLSELRGATEEDPDLGPADLFFDDED